MTQHLLVTGGAGQLATDLALLAGDNLRVTAIERSELDITDAQAVRACLEATKPDSLINCAAWTAVDDCESDPERADAINGTAVGVLRDACEASNTHLVQISTDYVFDGSKTGPYLENDTPDPASAYGRSKLMGEQLAGPDAAVVRTSWVYSRHGGNMAATICRLADQHDTLRFVADQVGHPTYTADLAHALVTLAENRSTGIWHCTNAGAVSWHEFAQAILAARGDDPERVLPIATADLDPPRPAPRPKNSVLANQRFDETFTPLRDFRDNLVDVVAAYGS